MADHAAGSLSQPHRHHGTASTIDGFPIQIFEANNSDLRRTLQTLDQKIGTMGILTILRRL
jgi:hypothetical protein